MMLLWEGIYMDVTYPQQDSVYDYADLQLIPSASPTIRCLTMEEE